MGDRKCEKEENGKKHHRVERAYGSFGRSFSLPDDASRAKVTADFEDGVLKVHLARTRKPDPSKSKSASPDWQSAGPGGFVQPLRQDRNTRE